LAKEAGDIELRGVYLLGQILSGNVVIFEGKDKAVLNNDAKIIDANNLQSHSVQTNSGLIMEMPIYRLRSRPWQMRLLNHFHFPQLINEAK